MIIGFCVSYSLLRFFDGLPTKNPITKAAILSCIALAVATILIDVPHSFLLLGPRDDLHYFLIGILLNIPRFLFLGIVIGYLHKRLYRSA